MIRHLNGWQRLWVLLSVTWIIIVGVFASTMIPKASDYTKARLYDTIDAVEKHLEKQNPDYHYIGAWEMRTQYYPDLKDDEILDELHSKYKDTVDFTPIEREYRKKMDNLRGEQLKAVGISLLAWLIPSLVIYISGYGVGWVVKGFRQPAKKE